MNSIFLSGGIVNTIYNEVYIKIEKVLREEKNFDKRLQRVVNLLKVNFEKYDWVGIYLKNGDTLVLHNYIGKPTAHTHIPINQGICGAAVREKQTIIVDDVNSDSRYIACSLDTNSEIVVPIFKGEEIIGEIDIDSDEQNAFNSDDKKLLEKVAAII